MAIKAQVYFILILQADGTSSSILTNTNSTPYLWGNSSSANLAPILSSLNPTAINSLSSSDGQAVTATVGLLGAVTYNWPNPPAAGYVAVNGYMEF